jgi:hypothetical protein
MLPADPEKISPGQENHHLGKILMLLMLLKKKQHE